MLSEGYKSKIQKLAGITITESKDVKWEYQVRDIGGPVFYKRKKGEKTWSFISAEDFAEGCKEGDIVKWEEKKK